MGTLSKFLAGTGMLIAIYLFLDNYTATKGIISQLGATYSQGVKTLQGR